MDNLKGIELTAEDFIDLLEERAEKREFTIRLTADEEMIEQLKNGIHSIDLQVNDSVKDMFMVTWPDDSKPDSTSNTEDE